VANQELVGAELVDAELADAELADAELLRTAMVVRQGVIRLARRLRLERGQPGETVLDVTVLSHLHRRGPMTAGQLATAERIQPQSLTRTLAGLQEQEFITRHADPADGRRSLMAITDKGLWALRDDMEQRDAWLAQVLSRQLTSTERDLLRLAGGLLDQLADADADDDLPGRLT
jgi:DNA-binding MarR family transcriptional regulator